MEKARNLREALDHYCSVSKQKVNFAKSSIFFNPTEEESFIREVIEVFSVRQVEDPRKYLGLPTLWGRSRKDVLNYLKKRIRDKLHSWRNHLLNNAGKEVLIKSVITLIPTYVMNVLKLPNTWCKEVNSMIAQFWWGTSNGD